MGGVDSWQGLWLCILHLPVVTQSKQLYFLLGLEGLEDFLSALTEGSVGIFVAGVGGILSGKRNKGLFLL